MFVTLRHDDHEASSRRAYAHIADEGDQEPLPSAVFNELAPSFDGSIGTPSGDIAMLFPLSSLFKSLTVPPDLAAAAGEAGDRGSVVRVIDRVEGRLLMLWTAPPDAKTV